MSSDQEPERRKSKPRRRRFGTIVRRVLSTGETIFQARWPETFGGPKKNRNFPSKAAAIDFLRDLDRRRPAPGHEPRVVPVPQPDEPASSPVFIEYARKVVDQVLAPVRAAKTVALYRRNLAVAEGFFGARREGRTRIPAARLTNINAGTLFAYRAWRKKQMRYGRKPTEVSNATVNRDVQFVRVVLTHAVQDGLLSRNPIFGLKDLKLKEPRLGRRWLSKHEAGRLIHAAQGLFRVYVVAALTTGCRPQELKALRWSDIDFDGGHLHVFRKKVGLADALPLHPALERKLRALRRIRTNARPEDFIFVNPETGRPWVDFRKAWRRALRAAEIPARKGLSPYSLRHSFATHFLEGGGAITDLQSILGHSEITTTQVYAAPVDERRRDSVLRLNFLRTAVGGTPTRGKGPSSPDGSGAVGEEAARRAHLVSPTRVEPVTCGLGRAPGGTPSGTLVRVGGSRSGGPCFTRRAPRRTLNVEVDQEACVSTSGR